MKAKDFLCEAEARNHLTVEIRPSTPADRLNEQQLLMVTDAMEVLRQIPTGGVGDNGSTMSEIQEAENCGHCVEDDATYHVVQKAWWILRRLTADSKNL